MFLGRTIVHGIYILCFLSRMRPGEVVSSVAVGEAVEVPSEQARKILTALTSAELVTSVRGRSGGYTLAKSPQEISMLDVVEALHPEAGLTALRPRTCPVANTEMCCVQPGLTELHDRLRDRVRAVFAGRTLASIIGIECRRESRSTAANKQCSPESLSEVLSDIQ